MTDPGPPCQGLRQKFKKGCYDNEQKTKQNKKKFNVVVNISNIYWKFNERTDTTTTPGR